MMNRPDPHKPRMGKAPATIIPLTSRKSLGVDRVTEHTADLVELRTLNRHADGSHSPSQHRTTIKFEALPGLIAALARLLTEGRR